MTAIKALVIIMAVLIMLGLGLIAAKLSLNTGDGSAQSNPAVQSVPYPRVVHMSGAGDFVVMVIETAAGKQSIRILNPASGAVTDQPLQLLVE